MAHHRIHPAISLMDPTAEPQIEFRELQACTLEVILTGDWTSRARRPGHQQVMDRLGQMAGPKALVFDTQGLGRWDSLLLTFLAKLIAAATRRGLYVDRSGLPEGVRGILGLADAVPEQEGVRREAQTQGVLERIGHGGIAVWREALAEAEFLGEAALAMLRFLGRRARYRKTDLGLLIQECGANALPIVSVISLLVGMILAFVGSVQLSNFGAQVFIADMVGLGMSREMGALMTAIIMAGRTGAAFAAHLGTMLVNDEIDALRTMGFSPMEFLVLPRLLALILMMPLLCVYADFMGMVGGGLVSISLFDISILEYSHRILVRLRFQDFAVGVGKSAVFGTLVAMAGCMRGLQCGRSSLAVGLAATSAVVTSIVMIVCADAVMTLLVVSLHW